MKKIVILPLLIVLIVGASFAGCIGTNQASSTHKGEKVLVGFQISFRVWKMVGIDPKTNKTFYRSPPDISTPFVFLIKPYLILKNGTKILLTKDLYVNAKLVETGQIIYITTTKLDPDACFYVLLYNWSKGFGISLNYPLPYRGGTIFYFSAIWTKWEYYHEVLPLLKNATKVELIIGVSNFPFNATSFTWSVLHRFLKPNVNPFLYINWTIGENLTEHFLYSPEHLPKKGAAWIFKFYGEVSIKPIYMKWGQYPKEIYPWQVSGNDYVQPPMKKRLKLIREFSVLYKFI